MDYFNQPRTDIPPFKSFADALQRVTIAVESLKAEAEYANLKPYRNLLCEIKKCHDCALQEEKHILHVAEEYKRLQKDFVQHFSSPPHVREEIQKKLRKLAYNPITETSKQYSIEALLAEIAKAHQSLQSILDKKRDISVLRNVSQPSFPPSAGEKLNYDDLRGE